MIVQGDGLCGEGFQRLIFGGEVVVGSWEFGSWCSGRLMWFLSRNLESESWV